jgi:hypothetical protein
MGVGFSTFDSMSRIESYTRLNGRTWRSYLDSSALSGADFATARGLPLA